MDAGFNHRVLELTAVVSGRLADGDGLAAMVVAASGAVGMFALGPPVVRDGPRGVAVGLLCREGHIVVHALPAEGICFVDIVARAPANVDRGMEVITRRLQPPADRARS